LNQFMTWILPKQLHTSACALDTAALSLDSNEQSQICAQSLFVRSKPSPSQIWLRKWKRDSWTRHLSGRILKPSLGERFVTAWTSSLADTLVSPSAQPVSAKESKTRGTCGRGLQMAFDFSDPESASLRTSKDISAWGCPTSSKTWQEWVTERRGAYSARLKSAHRTSESESSSWPTVRHEENWQGHGSTQSYAENGANKQVNYRYNKQGEKVFLLKGTFDITLTTAVMAQNWPSPVASEVRQGFQDRSRGMKGSQESLTTVVVKQHGPAVPASSSTDGSRPGSWATPRANKTEGYSRPDFGPTLHQQAQSWATPRAEMDSGAHNGRPDTLHSQMKVQAVGKLNPRWVETLMGLPVGWTMPSCASPVTIERMNSDCLATASSQPPQNGLS
jgi:hypothetical protein